MPNKKNKQVEETTNEVAAEELVEETTNEVAAEEPVEEVKEDKKSSKKSKAKIVTL